MSVFQNTDILTGQPRKIIVEIGMKIMFFLTMCLACGPRLPPEYISIDRNFSNSEADTIRAAVGAWCDAVNWCPAEVSWSEKGRIDLVDSLGDASGSGDCANPNGCRMSGYNYGDTISIASDRPSKENMSFLWNIISHELGHFCAQHTDIGLMSPYIHSQTAVLSIDSYAIESWYDGCY